MSTRAARQIRAGILAAQAVIRQERVERTYDDETLFGQAYRKTLYKHWLHKRLWREADKWL